MTVSLCLPNQAKGQVSEEVWRLLLEIVEVSNSTSPETAREALAQCKMLGEKLAGMTEIDTIQRLYLEGEVAHCAFYAMHKGEFADENGDQCSHHLESTAKFAEVIKQAAGKPGYQGDMMREVGDRLESGIRMGPTLGCTGDYEAFRPALAEAQRLAALPPPPDPMAFLDEVSAAQSDLKPDTARDVQKNCEALSVKIPELATPAQRLYFEAAIENCVAVAKSVGSYADETGDLCASHFRYASKLAEGLVASRDDMSAQMVLVPMMEGQLEVAKRQGPDMGCKQDYGALKSR
jgi:hypothetical protein